MHILLGLEKSNKQHTKCVERRSQGHFKISVVEKKEHCVLVSFHISIDNFFGFDQIFFSY